MNNLEELQITLKYEFSDIELLERSLTHPSVIKQDGTKNIGYERLEFLGDRVLGLIAAQMVMEKFPNEAEGDLAKRHTAVVRGETLAKVAESLELGSYLFLSEGERKTGGRKKSAILADAMEAVLAAIYLDGGYAEAVKFTRRHWNDLVDAHLEPPMDAKTRLQEVVQSTGHELPQYKVLSQTGPQHSPNFKVEVSATEYGSANAVATSKRSAEKMAAARLLEKIEEKLGTRK